MIIYDDLSAANVDVLLAQKGWQNRYRCLLQWSKLICEKKQLRIKKYLVKGCALETWLYHEEQEGLHYFAVDSDSRVVKGLSVVLLLHIHQKSAAEILEFDIDALMNKLDLEKHLSPSRGNGFKALWESALARL